MFCINKIYATSSLQVHVVLEHLNHFLLLVFVEGGKKGWGGGGGSRSRFTENELVLSQFTGKKIGISHFTKKCHFLP